MSDAKKDGHQNRKETHVGAAAPGRWRRGAAVSRAAALMKRGRFFSKGAYNLHLNSSSYPGLKLFKPRSQIKNFEFSFSSSQSQLSSLMCLKIRG